MKSLGNSERKQKITDAVNKVASADIGAFCNISDPEGKVMITIENMGEANNVNLVIQGDLSDDVIEKIQQVIENHGGDIMMMQITCSPDKAPDIVEEVIATALGKSDYNVNIELALE